MLPILYEHSERIWKGDMKQLWYGGTIYTMEKESETVEAVLVENDKIIAVGSVADLKNQANKKTDLQGAAMYPGFVDSHLHMLFQGEKLTRLDLSKATSAEDMLNRIKEAALTTPPEGKWLFGEGRKKKLYGPPNSNQARTR